MSSVDAESEAVCAFQSSSEVISWRIDMSVRKRCFDLVDCLLTFEIEVVDRQTSADNADLVC